MSDSLKIFGTTYNNVTGIVASDPLGNELTYTHGSSPTPTPGEDLKMVYFIDYDGAVLYSYTAAEFAELSVLPANPTHTGLTAQGWNWTLEQITAQLTAMPNQAVWVGQMYITTSGDTEFDLTFDDTDLLSPYLAFCTTGSVTIDWGDNSPTETVTGSSQIDNIFTPHTYASTGSYTLKLTPIDNAKIYFTYYNNSKSGSLFFSTGSPTDQAKTSRYYSSVVRAIRVGRRACVTVGAFANSARCVYITLPINSMYDMSGSQNYAFIGCSSLVSLTLPNSVTTLESNLCDGCASLTSVSIPSSAVRINTGGCVFSNCYSLTSVTIPSGFSGIFYNNVFSYCYSLKSISIPSGVTELRDGAFMYCQSLETVSGLNGVTAIGASVFSNCSKISSIPLSSGLLTIGNAAFQQCSNLKSISIPNTVTSIGTSVFNACWSLRTITIPSTIPLGSGSSLFYECRSLQSISLPSSSSAGSYQFAMCKSLQSVTIPSDITIIDSYCFRECSGLTQVILPSTITEIKEGAFQFCYNLREVNIPSGVTTIGSSAFYYCYTLRSLTVPATVATIKANAFNTCYGMQEYHFLATTPPTLSSTNVFSNIQTGTKIYVPYSADHSVLNAYKTATNWSTYASKIQEEPQ